MLNARLKEYTTVHTLFHFVLCVLMSDELTLTVPLLYNTRGTICLHGA
jgi:hypothetical protein